MVSKNFGVLNFFLPKKCNVSLIWFVLLCCIILALSGIEWHIPIFLSFLCVFLEIYSCPINVGFCARVIDMDLIRKNAKAFQFFSSFLNFKMLWGKFVILFGSIHTDDICLGNGLYASKVDAMKQSKVFWTLDQIIWPFGHFQKLFWSQGRQIARAK